MNYLDIYIHNMKNNAEVATVRGDKMLHAMCKFAYRTAEECKDNLDKQRKEPRWIGVAKNGETTMHYKDKATLIENINRMGPSLNSYQLIQIYVEV